MTISQVQPKVYKTTVVTDLPVEISGFRYTVMTTYRYADMPQCQSLITSSAVA